MKAAEQEAAAAKKRAAELEQRLKVAEEKAQAAERAKPPAGTGEPPKAVNPAVLSVFRDKLKDGSEGPEMVAIPAGDFVIGSPDSEAGRFTNEGPPRPTVKLKAFALGKTEVTVDEYRRFVKATGYKTDAERDAGGNAGCKTLEDGKWEYRAGRYWDNTGFSQGGKQPVACISWNDAKAYVKWLAERTGQGYRLPSEAEWEYAARAGTKTARYWGDNPDDACRYANVADQTKNPWGSEWSEPRHNCKDEYWFSAPVASFKPNAWGLYDMMGNVWEWAEDWYHDSYNGLPPDGSAWVTGGEQKYRVLRGGSWNNSPRDVRSAVRGIDVPGNRFGNAGFRVARTLP